MKATVIGAGLAGCEAAWQLAKRGVEVTLIEQKPIAMSPAHQSPLFAELVCSNSLRSDRIQNAVGLLKEEMRKMDSLILKAADHARVPAGGALAVDRDTFSGFITDTLKNHPLVTVEEKEITEIPAAPAIIATGPLTSDKMAEAIANMPEVSTLNFYDAAAPIVTAESLNMDKVFRASRYGRGEDYLNCPMTREEYDAFVEALLAAETAPIHGFEEKKVFEGCMPVESMARRGHMVLAFGPMKPVGLPDPKTGKEAYAILQLRQDDAAGTLYNLVGFQTRLKFPEQKRVFGMIPGLENAEFARYGVMHRNTFLNSPGLLDCHYQMIARPGLYFAGQMTGVEGYVESAASGMVAGINLARQLQEKPLVDFTSQTALGALAHYISTPNSAFQPMNVTYGIIDGWPGRIRNKIQRYEKIAERALEKIDALKEEIDN
ncbi:MAG: methylenetetrahydrofolate--tRNA-(uracil(54)-C(5))-methyltransferase (FADH(2)-oxidizing) TrmFO [Clostridiales bacterium]|nr:methylenetetrahydrofolate--tRNA-(uracil(54)-C(5))-methyltransferase (FADH(2)-oxidizing) TrmFO [Clostridiales bacterium]